MAMGMDWVKLLNAEVAKTANTEKAKRIRAHLLLWGGVLAVLGVGGVFTCFVLFVTGGMSLGVGEPPSARMLVPFFLFVPLGMVGALGAALIKMGLAVVVAGITTKYVDNINLKCAACRRNVKADEKFCPACGAAVRLACMNCKTENDNTSTFCKGCGQKLNA